MKWHKTIRESGLVEHICEHGCGHPDFESAKRMARKLGNTVDLWLVHGCDGCCERKDFPGIYKKHR